MNTYHIPALAADTIKGLNIQGDGIYVDVTFGGGGHSKEILKNLGTGKLYAFDQDEDAAQNVPNDSKICFIQHNFRYIQNFLRYYGVEQVDGILADLGVSSHHFDIAERGFSFRYQGNLDMRMNRNATKTAADIVNEYNEENLIRIFKEYGEVENAGRLARVIIKARTEKPITTTDRLMEIAGGMAPAKNEKKYMAKVYQSLRIEINDEMGALRDLLEQGMDLLKPGGRFVIITYHSLEDRMVKNFFRSGNIEGKVEKDFYGRIHSGINVINRKVIVPTDEEIEKNPRVRSAKLRIAEKSIYGTN